MPVVNKNPELTPRELQVLKLLCEQEKTEDIEYLPISDQAVDILKDCKREQRATGTISLYVFPKVKETDMEKRTREKHVNYSIKKWAKAAGFDPKKMHFHNT